MEKPETKIEEIIGHARRYAESGGYMSVLVVLGEARVLASRNGLQLPEAELKQIEQTAYANRVEEALSCARVFAGKGRVLEVEIWTHEAKAVAAKAGRQLAETELQEIEQSGYKNGVQPALDNAKLFAREGLVEDAVQCLEEAKGYALRVGIELPSALLQEVERDANQTRIETALFYAKGFAQDGWGASAWNRLREARECARKLGVDIGNRAAKVEALLESSSTQSR